MPPSSGSRGRARPADRHVVVTPGGLRFVGRATELVSEPSPVAAVAALRPNDLLWATRFSLRPRAAGGDAVGILLSVLDDALAAAGAPAESLRRDGAQCSVADRFRAVEWETFEHAGRWAGELTWIHKHPTLPGVPCTTRVAVKEDEGNVSATVHVGAHGVRGTVGAGQARPAFVHALTHVARLGFGWSDEPQVLLERDVDDFVRNELLSEIRSHPLAVLAPLETDRHAGAAEYVIPPADLAQEMRGLAPLRYLERHQATYRLSDALGDKRLSCYWGALRVYMPEFSCADSGREHPLLVRDRLEDPVMRSGLIGELGRAACLRIPVPRPVAELKAVTRPPAERAAEPARQELTASTSAADGTGTPAGVEETSSEGATALAAAGNAADAPGSTDGIAHALERFVDDLGSKLDRLVELNEALIDEIARLRTATVVRTANVSGVERRLGQFERMLREHLRLDSAEPPWPHGTIGTGEVDEAAGDDDQPDLTLVEVVQHAESEHADALLVLDSAVTSAADSPYEDVHRVASYLKAMAEIAVRRQDGRLGMSLREAFQEAGLEYRGHIARSTSSRLREQYVAVLPGGQKVECHEHIVLGTSYDPRYCLRIYFTSRAPEEPRFVISHVGRHFEVATTT